MILKKTYNKQNSIDQLNLTMESIMRDRFPVGDLLFQLMNIAIEQGGLSALSSKTGLGRESLYKILSPQGNPHLTTFFEIVRGLGLKVRFEANDESILDDRITDYLNNLTTLLQNKLLSEFHPIKNSLRITDPTYFVAGSHKRIWWQCPEGDDHEWVTSVTKRINGAGCPMCEGKKIVTSNSLASTHPQLLQEWDFDRNINSTPEKVIAKSNKKIWWRCNQSNRHIWVDTISNRALGSGCPYCINASR